MLKTDRSEKFFNIILDSITDGVFTVDRNWVITSFNRAAEDITGVSREDAIGQQCCDVFHASICQDNCALRSTIDTGREVVDLPINILNSSGRRVPVRIGTAVLRDEEGRIVGGVETFHDLSEVEELRREISGKYTFENIVSQNHEIQNILAILPDIAESESTALIQGPSGSGKELFARAIHNLSSRAGGPFVAVNAGAIPDTLLESELFGYVKGAFTDARRDKPGRFALAEGGTLLLDEVGELSPALQVKLLRVLQEKQYEPLGATTPQRADVRIIAATNRDLAQMAKEREFRQDLFYRINVIKIELPPLRRHREDIPLLVEHIIRRLNTRTGKQIAGVSNSVMNLLMRHDFPGNVRELENIMEHGFILCKGPFIEVRHLPGEIAALADDAAEEAEVGGRLENAEQTAILMALHENHWHRARTAQSLGIDKTTLWRKMKKYSIQRQSSG